jgi:hypothetical protein
MAGHGSLTHRPECSLLAPLTAARVFSTQVAEEWMNRRVRRSASMRAVAAPYVGSYEDDGLRATDSKVLLWELKGELTLEQAMGLKDFPLCLEEQVGDELQRWESRES